LEAGRRFGGARRVRGVRDCREASNAGERNGLSPFRGERTLKEEGF
jgi:hypothetical protein